MGKYTIEQYKQMAIMKIILIISTELGIILGSIICVKFFNINEETMVNCFVLINAGYFLGLFQVRDIKINNHE